MATVIPFSETDQAHVATAAAAVLTTVAPTLTLVIVARVGQARQRMSRTK